jgi:RNA polymerase-binding transcription factor DksA
MIKTHSDDPDVAAAAARAAEIVRAVLGALPSAETYDYGGHNLRIGEYDVCERCSRPIAEAQQAAKALVEAGVNSNEDEEVLEHLDLAATLFQLEAQAALIRAELHNGENSEDILNQALGFIYDRHIGDAYDHTHHSGGQQ